MSRELNSEKNSAPSPERVLVAALRLKPRQRAALADQLLESLPPDPKVGAAWEAEIKRRIQELESGAVKPIPWSIARRQIFAPRRRKE